MNLKETCLLYGAAPSLFLSEKRNIAYYFRLFRSRHISDIKEYCLTVIPRKVKSTFKKDLPNSSIVVIEIIISIPLMLVIREFYTFSV